MTEAETSATGARSYADDVSPDSLMSDFRGRPLAAIVIFTVIVHVAVIGAFSIGYMRNAVFGEDTSAMSEDERVDLAVRDATSSLREIAERYGISPQELSDRFSRGKEQAIATSAEAVNPDASITKPEETESESQEPKSAIESQLQMEAAGPDLPDLPSLEEEDLFN
ncbi:MAG: hypothetical protein P8L85_00020 [Rubripirellula sp.]|nr:hypothetical protein [Rubripirellula sp.]